MQFRVSAAAQRDLEEIFLYWAKRVSQETADRVIERIIERFPLLGAYPGIGRFCPEIAAKVRCFPAGKYLIYFQVSSKHIDILHVFHGARDQARALGENDPKVE